MGSQEGNVDVGSTLTHTLPWDGQRGNGEPVVSEPCPPRAPSAPHILCASSRCCSTKEGIRISGQRYMRLVPSGILLWTPGTMSQCPKGDCVGLGRMCLTLGKWTLGTEEEE